MCGDKGVNCSWGQAINVANRYVYVSQPTKDRVLVISKIQMVVVDVSTTQGSLFSEDSWQLDHNINVIQPTSVSR